jgi:hypothetical protein
LLGILAGLRNRLLLLVVVVLVEVVDVLLGFPDRLLALLGELLGPLRNLGVPLLAPLLDDLGLFLLLCGRLVTRVVADGGAACDGTARCDAL